MFASSVWGLAAASLACVLCFASDRCGSDRPFGLGMMIEGKRFAASRGFDLGNDTVELERNCFRLPLCIDRSPRGPLRHVAASLPDQPLPLAADMQHREIACAERRAFDWKAAALEMGEPVCHWAIIAKSDQ